ncbi:ribosomal protein S18-alanine N-acetyltransferase [Prochlorococcus marinus]|uniref:[Ribosomal protein bS18]-alanine N-acetyltransferase n=1 Tax=Prochlorococcus marinus XMU1408 TaxID=2213228 RepID=A0A318R3U7_PROMR|nr:ribosomal protein S18-alanine N-acetyltransferase [Prochlorococcus marinus]MBW3042265.1 ribosomal-protein-alanine N-acetyltransferase [Prochlorococcus marinus str. XMU1408]PYE01653.1 ribosomal-protein-alanine N-acetyltransferase [Prochlorococcus marinus XMU1408]
MNLKIIQLEEMHLNDCFDLDQKSLKGLWTKDQWQRELTDPKRICLGTIDIETKKLLGLCSAWLVTDELHITSIAVHPIHKRKGIGKVLISDLIKRAKALSTKHIILEVKDRNEEAKSFYKSMGFKIVGHRSNFYKDGSDALILTKGLFKK